MHNRAKMRTRRGREKCSLSPGELFREALVSRSRVNRVSSLSSPITSVLASLHASTKCGSREESQENSLQQDFLELTSTVARAAINQRTRESLLTPTEFRHSLRADFSVVCVSGHTLPHISLIRPILFPRIPFTDFNLTKAIQRFLQLPGKLLQTAAGITRRER